MPVTILDYVTYKTADKHRYARMDFTACGVAMTGRCEHCRASIAAGSAFPSASGYWRCAGCIGSTGFAGPEDFDAHMRAASSGVFCPDSPVQESGSVRLCKIKRPGGVFWFDLRLAGQDGDGTWLRGGTGYPWGAPHDRGASSVPVVVLLAPGRPWVAWWVGDPAGRQLSIDVCLPPERTGAGWRFIDLELDPVLHERDFRVEIEDWDEYEQACRTGWMSPDDARLARVTAGDRAEALRRRDEPWQQRGWTMLARQT